MFLLGGVFLLVCGYAFVYTGISQLSQGAYTGGNVQGLTTSLGLDRLGAAAAGATAGSGSWAWTPPGMAGPNGPPSASGPVTAAPSGLPDVTTTPLNSGSTVQT